MASTMKPILTVAFCVTAQAFSSAEIKSTNLDSLKEMVCDQATTPSIFKATLANDCEITLPKKVRGATKDAFCAAGASGTVHLARTEKEEGTGQHWMGVVEWSGDCLPPTDSCDIDGTSYNTTVIGMHIHEGSAKENGPVRIVFCGSGTPLGTLKDEDTAIEACGQTSGGTIEGGVCTSPDPPCTTTEETPDEIYFNVHTPWSLDLTKGNGAIRGQLEEVDKDEFCS